MYPLVCHTCSLEKNHRTRSGSYNDPRGGAIFDPNMKALGLVVSEKKIFYVFSIVCLWKLMTPGAGQFLTPGAWLAGFIKRTTTHCYIKHIKALGLVVSEKKIFYVFSHDAPRAGPVWTPGARLAGLIKMATIHFFTQNMKALGLVVSEKIVLCFSYCMSMGANDPRGGARMDPGARLAGFIKRTIIHCYTQNMKALGLVVSEKKIFLCFPIVSLWELSVAMETRVLIRPGPKANTTFPTPQ